MKAKRKIQRQKSVLVEAFRRLDFNITRFGYWLGLPSYVMTNRGFFFILAVCAVIALLLLIFLTIYCMFV